MLCVINESRFFCCAHFLLVFDECVICSAYIDTHSHMQINQSMTLTDIFLFKCWFEEKKKNQTRKQTLQSIVFFASSSSAANCLFVPNSDSGTCALTIFRAKHKNVPAHHTPHRVKSRTHCLIVHSLNNFNCSFTHSFFVAADLNASADDPIAFHVKLNFFFFFFF